MTLPLSKGSDIGNLHSKLVVTSLSGNGDSLSLNGDLEFSKAKPPKGDSKGSKGSKGGGDGAGKDKGKSKGKGKKKRKNTKEKKRHHGR